MIDTVVLLLSSDMYTITDPDRFVPSAVAKAMADTSARFSPSAVHGIQSKQNPTKKELLAGIYKPRLTLFYSFPHKEVMLKIELSLPKLFFGNNFQELKQKDLQPFLQRLSDTLGQMEVIVAPDDLARAPLVAVHYSKNISLTDGSTPYHYISKIKESNIKMSLDTNQTDYRNEGHSYKWHCNSYEIVFYDKIKDLEKAKQSEKRAIEKDNAIQLEMFPRLHKKNPAYAKASADKRKLEVLRMEVRLNKRAKMKQLFGKLEIKTDLSLKSLFKPATSKKVLLHYLDELESKRPTILDYKPANDKALLVDLIFNNPDLGSKNIIQIYGLSKALEVMNMRELRSMLSKQNQKDWHRLMANTKQVRLPGILSPFRVIRKHLIAFKPLIIKKLIT